MKEVLATGSDQDVLLAVNEFYQSHLATGGQEVDKFLARNCIDAAPLLERYGIGFSNRKLGLELPAKQVKAGAEARKRLQSLGIYRVTGHEHLSGSFTIPIYDISGVLVNMYGHKVLSNLRKGTPIELCINKSHQLWNVQAGTAHEELIVCASILDGLRCCAEGLSNVVALVNGVLDQDCFSTLREHSVKRLVLLGDIGVEPLNNLGFDCYQASLGGKDTLVDLLNSYPNPKEALYALVKQSPWVGSTDKAVDEVPVFQGGLDDLEVDEFQDLQDVDNDFHLMEDLDELEHLLVDENPAEEVVLPVVRVPVAPVEPEVIEEKHQVSVMFKDRLYRVRGLYGNGAYQRIKVSVLAKFGDRFHMDDINLYQSRSRTMFINQVKAELGQSEEVIKSDVGKLIFILEGLLEKFHKGVVAVERRGELVTDTQHSQALEYLSEPNLLENILGDFKTLDVIGSRENLLACYLAATSRLLDDPIAITIQSASASGKTSLMNGVLSLMPDSDIKNFSSMTSQSLYYMGETELKHKILAVSELEGANTGNSSYSLKLLQSEKSLTIATTHKDDSGGLRTVDKTVHGPVQFFATTTQIDVDDELLNRTLVISIEDDQETTQAIHEIQRKKHTLEGRVAKASQQAIVQRHHNLQLSLKKCWIVNPYAEQLTFLSCKTRTRRDHQKYLNLIQAITFLHQYQRPLKTTQLKEGDEPLEYIETTKEDIEVANQIAHAILGNSLLEDLPPQSKSLLNMLKDMVDRLALKQGVPQAHVRFTRGDIRAYIHWSISQLKTHCKRLEELEYLLKHTGGRGQRIEYELLWTGEGKEGESFSMGLVNINELELIERHTG